jgi:hypothetical protein
MVESGEFNWTAFCSASAFVQQYEQPALRSVIVFAMFDGSLQPAPVSPIRQSTQNEEAIDDTYNCHRHCVGFQPCHKFLCGHDARAGRSFVRPDDQGCGRLRTWFLARPRRRLPSVRTRSSLPSRLSYRGRGTPLLAELIRPQIWFLHGRTFSPAVCLFRRGSGGAKFLLRQRLNKRPQRERRCGNLAAAPDQRRRDVGLRFRDWMPQHPGMRHGIEH